MLSARDLTFRHRGAPSPVLDRVSLAIRPGEIVGLTGRSGCGKSTLGRVLAGHLRPASGMVTIGGGPPAAGGFHPVQYLAQSPELAVDPRWRIGRVLSEAWDPDPDLRDRFGIRPDWHDRFPHELSGGELQRVAILRALAPPLRHLVADEITAMLDTVSQAEIWRLLLDLARARPLGLLVISHDMALLGRVADRVLVLAEGRLAPA